MKILLAGDTHGDSRHWQNLCTEARDTGCEKILQLGDFGFWTHTKQGQLFLKRARELTHNHNLKAYFIDGNHENFDNLWTYTVRDDEGFIKIARDDIKYIPRGMRWEWGGISFLGLGGAHSVDKHYRTMGVSWWPQEDIRAEDVERALTAIDIGGPVDIMVTHDAPAGVNFINEHNKTTGWKNDSESYANRKAISAVLEHANPSVLFHGHHHVEYREVLRYGAIAGGIENMREAVVVGLGCNPTLSDSTFVLDTQADFTNPAPPPEEEVSA